MPVRPGYTIRPTDPIEAPPPPVVRRPGRPKRQRATWLEPTKNPRSIRYVDPEGVRKRESVLGLTPLQIEARREELEKWLANPTPRYPRSEHTVSMSHLLQEGTTQTIAAAADAIKKAAVEKGVRPSTLREYTRVWKELPGLLKAKRIEFANHLTIEVAKPLLSRILELAPSKTTGNKNIRALKRFLRIGVKQGLFRNITLDQISSLEEVTADHAPKGKLLSVADLKKILTAAIANDRDGKPPIAGIVACMMVTGARSALCYGLDWSWVDLDDADTKGRKIGIIRFPGDTTKTHNEHIYDLALSPGLRSILASVGTAQKQGPVWGAAAARESYVRARYEDLTAKGCPEWNPQSLRRAASSYLAAWLGSRPAADLLDHGERVAKRHYRHHTRVDQKAKTVDQLFGIGHLLAEVAKLVR